MWYEVCESVVTKWSKLPAERKSEKRYVNFLVDIIGDHADDVNILGRSVHTIKIKITSIVSALW